MSLPFDLWEEGKKHGAVGWTGDSHYTYTIKFANGNTVTVPREVTLADDRAAAVDYLSRAAQEATRQ